MINYEQLAARTMSPDFHGHMVSSVCLMCRIGEAAQELSRLDIIKKGLFYGKLDSTLMWRGETPINRMELAPLHPKTAKAIDILHCVIGIATEAGELLEAVYKALDEGKPLDTVNMAEEVGDVQWYCANLVNALDTTLDAVQKTNIAKLRTRYPEKFTSEAAINRDLDAERKVLE